jgi:uncharacterized membrane protein
MMNLDANFFPSWLLAFSFIIMVLALVLAAASLSWRQLLGDTLTQKLLAIAFILTVIFWSLRASPASGFSVHLFGIGVLTLLFSWGLALWLLFFTYVALALLGLEQWQALPLSWLITALVPITLIYLSYILTYHFLPGHYFFYLFIAGFVSTAAAITLMYLIYFLIVGLFTENKNFGREYLLYLPLISFPEAFVNTTILLLTMLLKPEWLKTFHNSKYLDHRD